MLIFRFLNLFTTYHSTLHEETPRANDEDVDYEEHVYFCSNCNRVIPVDGLCDKCKKLFNI